VSVTGTPKEEIRGLARRVLHRPEVAAAIRRTAFDFRVSPLPYLSSERHR
jgi:hypothetical protein